MKRVSKMMAGNEVKSQLQVYHNPFSGATEQPKIPDGKATHSLGFSTQSVLELNNVAGQDVMHLILFPGMTCGLVALNADQETSGFGGTRGYFVPDFSRSGAVNWFNITSAPTLDNDVGQTEGYAKWRTVSAGLQLKLLNSVEEDDGWWEACRINEPIRSSYWTLTTTNNGAASSILANEQGCLAPVQLVQEMATRQISNESSYMTGLLRDLNRVQFECHPVTHQHDFITLKDPVTLNADEYTYTSATVSTEFDKGSANVMNLIENFVDSGHDMVYIRLHCRSNTASTQGSRFHTNVVLNQEIIYDSEDRLARYQTRVHNIGSNNMGAHAEVRRNQGGAANMVVE